MSLSEQIASQDAPGANQWREHLSPAEVAELEEIDRKAGEIDAQRRQITDLRRRVYDRLRDRAKKRAEGTGK